MAPSSLVQYFRSFLVKLNMIESQIGQMYLGGKLGVPNTNSPVQIYPLGQAMYLLLLSLN